MLPSSYQYITNPNPTLPLINFEKAINREKSKDYHFQKNTYFSPSEREREEKPTKEKRRTEETEKMMKLKSKRFYKASFKFCSSSSSHGNSSSKESPPKGYNSNFTNGGNVAGGGDIKWEMRPGGMLVQKRESGSESGGEGVITVRVSTVSKWHDISIEATSTFGKREFSKPYLLNYF